MLGVVLCVFVWRMYEFLYQSTKQCFGAHSSLHPGSPHIRQELKCLRDNSSQIRNPRSQTTGIPPGKLFSPTYWKIQGIQFKVWGMLHFLFHHLPLESPFVNCSTGGPSESRLSSGWASRACLFWVAPHVQKKHVHSSSMRHQLHVFQRWFILYIYMLFFWGSVVFSYSLQTKKNVTT